MALNMKTDADDIVLKSTLSFINDFQTWQGPMTKLSSKIRQYMSKTEAKEITRSPSALRIVMNRIINRLRSRGVSVKFGRTSDERFVTLNKQ